MGSSYWGGGESVQAVRAEAAAASRAIVEQAERLREDARSVTATAASLVASMAAGSQAAATGAMHGGLESLSKVLEASAGRYSEATQDVVRSALGSLVEAVRAAQPSVSVEAAVIDLEPIARAIDGVTPTVMVDLAPTVAALDRLTAAQADTLRELRMLREAVQASVKLAAQPRHYSIRYDGERIAGVTVGG